MVSVNRLIVFAIATLGAGCGLEQGYQGRPRPLNEIAVLVGGKTHHDAGAPYWAIVDLVAVPDVPELAKSAGGMEERVYLLPGDHTLRVAYRKRFDAPLPLLIQTAAEASSDEGVTTLRLRLAAGRTYIVHYDVGGQTYWVSDSTSFMDQPTSAPLEPYPNSIECLAADGDDASCRVVDHVGGDSTQGHSVE